ncbi:MAG TPA: hypothetical protein VFW84_14505 [Aquabacterium sp.]|uniref:hypothetical protein n=1 Tax=Aquabacterium sp. TaxID=1872578 RepID=UPI002E32FD05|nr:hypothetical protein [Aquabacterium sp.]HEX5373934.1 hypothetical protein [Aquabacterium sp.]
MKHRTLAPGAALRPLVGAIALILASAPAHAADYTFLDGVGDHLWYSNAVYVPGSPPSYLYNWAPSGPPPNLSSTRVLVDNNPARQSVLQISPLSNNGSAIQGPSIGALVIDAGDTVVLGGSAPWGDNAVGYSRGDVQLIVGGATGSSISNHGLMRISSDGRLAKLGILGEVTLSGSGQTVMSNGYGADNARSTFNSQQIIYGKEGWGDRLIVASDHTVRGGGYLGYNGTLALTNHGRIIADSPSQLMVSSTYGIPAGQMAMNFNDGLMRAESGGRLLLNGSIDNTGGTLEAGMGSHVDLASGTVIRNGRLRSEGSGAIRVDAYSQNQGLIGDITLQGQLVVADGKRLQMGYDAVSAAVASRLDNQGRIVLGGSSPGQSSSGSAGGELKFYHDTLIDGTGRIELLDSPGRMNILEGYGNFLGREPVLTLGAGQVLSGSGTLGGRSLYAPNLSIVNQGRVEASGLSGMTVVGTAAGFRNEGAFVVSSTLSTSGTFINTGVFDLQAGAVITQGHLTQQAGTMVINGDAAQSTVFLQGGLLKGSGQLQRVVQTGGTFAPGNSPGTITLDQYTLRPGGELVLEIDGSDPGQYDRLIVTGNATLLGTVVLDFSDYRGGAVSFNDLITVGGTLLTRQPALGQSVSWRVQGLASGWQGAVDWGPQGLSLQVSSAVPEPEGWALVLAGLLTLGAWRRRVAGVAARA